MPRSSPRSHSSGNSDFTRTTECSGRCSSPHRWCRCGTRCGPHRNIFGQIWGQIWGNKMEAIMNKLKMRNALPMLAVLVACTIAQPPEAHAFCGFYVGKADSGLFNRASQVVMVRHGDKSVL